MKESNIDVNNFKDFSLDEHLFNLNRLGVDNYSELIGKQCYYCTPKYGTHVIESWDPDRVEYILNLDGCKFYSNPFRIVLI